MGAERTTGVVAAAAAIIISTFISQPLYAAEGASSEVSSAPRRRVVVSIPDRKLAVIENDDMVTVFPVAVGKPATPSPAGTFTIVNRVTNPTYYARDGKTVAPGAKNPVGTRWIGLSQKGYGIHGTDDPRSIGFAKSHGCIRLRNRDVEQLFERVRGGDVVELHAELTPEIAKLFADAK
jgi:lipoprotein-anchoring transpeptidase ErfK/SrfK